MTRWSAPPRFWLSRARAKIDEHAAHEARGHGEEMGAILPLLCSAFLIITLAVAIAHELGHMLLPNGKHAKNGLMAGPWDSGPFRAASAGLLGFSRDFATLIGREVAKEQAASSALAPSAPR